MTTSSGLGPANGSVTAGAVLEAYGRLNRLDARVGREVVLNMVFAKADGSACCIGCTSSGCSIFVVSTCFLGEGGGAFSWGFESFLFRRGKLRDDFDVDISKRLPSLCSLMERLAIGFSTSDEPEGFCSWALFFRAAARACNFDILGAPSDDPPNSPPLGYSGGIRIP